MLMILNKRKTKINCNIFKWSLNAQPDKCVSAKSKIMELKIRNIEGVKLNLCFLRELFLTCPVSLPSYSETSI